MGDHPNADRYRKGMEVFMSGDASEADKYISDDIVWWMIGAPEPLRGRQAVLESMSGLSGVDFELNVHDVVANDDHVIGLVTATVRVGEDSFTYRTAEIAHVKDGKLTERWLLRRHAGDPRLLRKVRIKGSVCLEGFA